MSVTTVLHPNGGVNPKMEAINYAVRGELVLRAGELSRQLVEHPGSLPFDDVVFCNIGNPQALGQKPLTFNSQVMALLNHPGLLDADRDVLQLLFPADAIARAAAMLKGMKGGLGAYTHSKGLPFVRESVARFIEGRDGHPADPETIFLTNGASPGIKFAINMLVLGPNSGIMLPNPQYPLYSATITEAGGTRVSYNLNEDDGWSLNVDELKRSLAAARADGVDVRGLVIINPGNPTGQCMSESDIRDVVRFAAEEKVVLLADEVYQENVYDKATRPFVSFKKVLRDMEAEGALEAFDPLELFSFHSVSKGLFGECGRRGGYLEATNLHPGIMDVLYKAASVSLCSNTVGQAMVDLMVNPPTGESAALYKQEADAIYSSLQRRSASLVKALNELEGVRAATSQGAMYVYPEITLPRKAIQAAADKGKAPDTYYALALLEATGICVVPGAGFESPHDDSQAYHFRSTFLPPEDKMDSVVNLMADFHSAFMDQHRDATPKEEL